MSKKVKRKKKIGAVQKKKNKMGTVPIKWGRFLFFIKMKFKIQ